MSNIICGLGAAVLALIIFFGAAALQAYEEKAEEEAALRRWEKRINAKYREEFRERYGDLDAPIGR